MSDIEELERLHLGLVSLSEGNLIHSERFWAELDLKLDEFSDFLDKPSQNNTSRLKLLSGEIEIENQTYSINDDFKHGSLQLSDALDLDELQAAKLFLQSQKDAELLDRSILTTAIVLFHERRQLLLECLRIILKMSADLAEEKLSYSKEDGAMLLLTVKQVIDLIIQNRESNASRPGSFLQRAIANMGDIKNQLQKNSEEIQGASLTGQYLVPQIAEIMSIQRSCLTRQHQTLSVVLVYLVKANQANFQDFKDFMSTIKVLDRYDNVLTHYFLVLTAFLSNFGSPEGALTIEEARAFHESLEAEKKDNDPWPLRYFQAAAIVWWLGEYSAWYLDQPAGPLFREISPEEEAASRSNLFMSALKDGAMEFLFAISAEVKPSGWHSPANGYLQKWLQPKVPALPPNGEPFSDHFQAMMMEQLDSFIDTFITNMPDTLRKLRSDQDEKRSATLQRAHDADLERFLIIVSSAFEDRPDAAQAFWSDPDSNLYGFLTWASRRSSTPLVTAFCEMLRSLSNGEDCATSAHKFLLEEGPSSSGKMRRINSLNWTQIFGELHHWISKIQDRPTLPKSTIYREGQMPPDQREIESESQIMLESYLRLISRLCEESAVVRLWLFANTSAYLLDTLFFLCRSAIPSRLRACALDVIRSLLKNKSQEISDHIWNLLDQWIMGGSGPSVFITLKDASADNTQLRSKEAILDSIANGFEEPYAFIRLLQELVAPYQADKELNDSLPFPESLGSTYRAPGVDYYIDFILGTIFAKKTSEDLDIVQLRLLRLGSLQLILTCLSSFNEDLVVFAGRSNVGVDLAIKASSVETYARLHPYARVMDWMFNDRVLKALFAASHQDISEVSSALPQSPLIIGLLHCLEIMNCILNLQSTYMQIVRPLLRNTGTDPDRIVYNNALVSFEESVLNNLQLIIDLGLYAGSGQRSLTIVSLKLLERLSSSKTLITSSSSIYGNRSDVNKMIGILEMHGDSSRIAKSLASEMRSLSRELNEASGPLEFDVKFGILDFLNTCLAALPNSPTIAHLLLGFSCNGESVGVPRGSPFASESSLFHAVLELVLRVPDTFDGIGFSPWHLNLKLRGLKLLGALWRSPITSIYSMTELRAQNFLALELSQLDLVTSESLWAGLPIGSDDFYTTNSSECLAHFLQQRSYLLEYATLEIHLAAQAKAPSLKSRILSTLLGSTTLDNGDVTQHASIFNLFDFAELEVDGESSSPSFGIFADIDFEICSKENSAGLPVHDLFSIEELLALRLNELKKSGKFTTQVEEEQGKREALSILAHIRSHDQRHEIAFSRLGLLKSWVNLLIMILQDGEFPISDKVTFILQTLQIVIPKLEKYSLGNAKEASELARLAKTLLFNLDFAKSSLDTGRAGDATYDRLFQLFRVAVRGIHSPISTPSLRETFYNICYQYLTGIQDLSGLTMGFQRRILQTVESSGEKLIDVLCDDAYDGDVTCRISALLLLDALVSLGKREDSKYMIESLVRLNYIGILVDSIKYIPDELFASSEKEVPLLLSYYKIKFSLLLRVSQTRLGASYVLNAGLFQCVAESQMFSRDPDIGAFEIKSSETLEKYYELLLAVIRVINSVVLSRGPQSDQTIQKAQKFLEQNRNSIFSTFKKQLKLKPSQKEDNKSFALQELIKSYVLLITMTNFLDLEDHKGVKIGGKRIFT
ncbi:MAG: hypothetical protein M1829_002954 [Trizodia sp. TS-e1964]|nr:MAG: hypothetical protein M1829_002954 [Trizodia sp. TS-e1964]